MWCSQCELKLMSLHQHEIVVAAGLAEGAVEHLHRAFAIALVEFLVGADHALGRVQQAFAVGIVAGIGDQRAHGGFGLLARGARLDRRGRRPHMLGQALLRPRLDDCILGVHDGSLRSTGTRLKGGAGSVTGVAASVTRSGPFRSNAGQLDAAFPFGMALKPSLAPRTPSRA